MLLIFGFPGGVSERMIKAGKIGLDYRIQSGPLISFHEI